MAALAVGGIVDPRADPPDGEVVGTAFAVDRQLALTAFHCVGDRSTGEIYAPQLRLRFEREDYDATVSKWDAESDVAILEVSSPLPADLELVVLTEAVDRHTRFSGPGWADTRPFVHDAITMSGVVVDPAARIFDGVAALQLFCEQAGAGAALSGFSGAPVMIPTPHGHAAAGLVRWNPQQIESPQLAEGGTVFACPVRAALERWPELRKYVVSAEVDAAVEGFEYGISYADLDEEWACWLATEILQSGSSVFIRRWALRPGDHYGESLQQGFTLSKQVLVLVSNNYYGSNSAIHQTEVQVLRRLLAPRLVPVKLDEVPFPDYLTGLTPIDLTSCDEDRAKRIISESMEPARVRDVLSRFPRVSEPEPQPLTMSRRLMPRFVYRLVRGEGK